MRERIGLPDQRFLTANWKRRDEKFIDL